MSIQTAIERVGKRLNRQMVAGELPTDIRINAFTDDRRAYERLLFSEYCERLGWCDPADHPTGHFTDPNDNNVTIVTIHRSGEIVAGMKLARDTAVGFPHEAVLEQPLSDLPNTVSKQVRAVMRHTDRDQIREVTRVIGSRKAGQTPIVDLMKCLLWCGLVENISAYFMVIDEQLFGVCRAFGLPIVPVSKRVFCEGSWTVPGVVITSEIVSAIRDCNGNVANYMKDGHNVRIIEASDMLH